MLPRIKVAISASSSGSFSDRCAEHDSSMPAPDGVRLVSMGAPGHAGEGCLCSEHATVNALLADIEPAASTAAVVDMEASPEQLSRGTVEHAEVLLHLTEHRVL